MAVQEAGAICIQDGKVLIIRSNKKPHSWLFPKGHIESGEKAEECAIRELEEETGVVGYILRKVGPLVFDREGATYEVQYFLCQYVGEIKAVEQRKFFWCPVDKASKILSFPDSHTLLQEAVFQTAPAVE